MGTSAGFHASYCQGFFVGIRLEPEQLTDKFPHNRVFKRKEHQRRNNKADDIVATLAPPFECSSTVGFLFDWARLVRVHVTAYFNTSANRAAASFALTCATLPAFFRYASLKSISLIVLDLARIATVMGSRTSGA